MDKNINKKLFEYAILFFSFSIPLYKPIQSYILFFVIIFRILTGNFKNSLKEILSSKHITLSLLLPAFFLIHLISLTYSENIKSGLFDLQVKLPFLIIPLLVLFSLDKIKENYDKILISFISGNFVASIICLCNAYQNSWIFENGEFIFKPYTYEESLLSSLYNGCNKFMYTALSIFHHPGYFALYINFSIAAILYLLEKYKNSLIKTYRIFIYLLILFFIIMIYLLYSRSGFICLILVLISYFFRYSKDNKKLKPLLIIFATLITIVTLLFNQRFKSAIFQTIHENNSNFSYTSSSYYAGERLFLWKITFDIIQKHFLFGLGTGDVKDKLMEEYKKHNANEAFVNKLNSHNQFLETWLSVGIVGFILNLLIFLIPIFKKLIRKDILFVIFLTICSIFLLFESAYNTQAGVLFFTFFYTILLSKNIISQNIKDLL